MAPRLPLAHQQPLCSSVTASDIKHAVFSIPGIKSPSPDGFNSTFFKDAWDCHGPLTTVVVQQFFRTSFLPPSFGHTKLVLLPKQNPPTTAWDFRPISCCSVIYKTIAKVLASRLKLVLPVLVHPNQGAFVPDRDLLYNVLISQDIV